PNDPGSRMPYARILELDEREEYPYEMLSPLRRWGLHEWLIPEACGGKAGSVEDGLQLTRLVSRRDPTTATAFMIYLMRFTPRRATPCRRRTGRPGRRSARGRCAATSCPASARRT